MTHSHRYRLRLPRWTAHPGFGVAALFAVAVLLIVHGEPQPSSRPSGKSVVASGTPTAPAAIPDTLVIRDGKLQYRRNAVARDVQLPDRAHPESVQTSRGVSIVLARLDDRQLAYTLNENLKVTSLGYADAVIPTATGDSAFILESAVTDPGRVATGSSSAASSSASQPSVTSSPTPSGTTESKDFEIRRYNASGRQLGRTVVLPRGSRVACDTNIGLVVWKPLKLLFDGSIQLEPLSAEATLIRPDGTLRSIGAVHPLASTATALLVWNVERRQFGIMPLKYVTSTATTTETPSATAATTTPAATESSASPSATPSTVADTTWFDETRGFTVIGPAAFSPDGSAFAVYAQVGSRRRLVVAQVRPTPTAQGNNPIEVLALSPQSATTTPSSTAQSASLASSTVVGSSSASPSPTTSTTDFTPQGFPIPAPLMPEWWGHMVVGLGIEGTLIGYQPGNEGASVLDIGVSGIESLAEAP
jgi:hypothetical protein